MTVAGTNPSAAGPTMPAPQAEPAAHPATPATPATPGPSVQPAEPGPASGPHQPPPVLDLDPGDPLASYLLSAGRAVDIRDLSLDSPALATLREAGVVLVIPLISAGALAGVLSLGPRRANRDYSAGDRRLLSALAGHAAPALRVGQLVRSQRAEARHRERTQQQLKVARVIQQHFLPRSPPDLAGWRLTACYQPALTVGGDFYDFIALPGGRDRKSVV